LINSQDYLGGRYPRNYDNLLYAKTSFVIELDDDKDLDILKSLLDPFLPANIILLNSEFDLFSSSQKKIDLSHL
jgi:hypothetical protein